jgi:hypothetical protein
LGGPEVTIEDRSAETKAQRNALRKRMRAQRVRERRQAAERARLAQLAASQQLFDPFRQQPIQRSAPSIQRTAP